MIYVLTNTQAVTDVGGISPWRKETALDQIRLVDLHLSADGFGDVLFRTFVSPDWTSRRAGFIAVPDATRVAGLLKQAVERASGHRLNEPRL